MVGKKKILLLGATGSVGDSTLAVMRMYPDDFDLVGVVAGSNGQKLAQIVNEFDVRNAALFSSDAESELINNVSNKECSCYTGIEGIIELIKTSEAEICVSAIVGSEGLLPTITAAEAGMDIALANKESLVAAGGLLMKLAEEHSIRIIPVDSEHSGILQCLQAGRTDEIERVIITASGGAFRDTAAEDLATVTPEMALKHPTWNMGEKITIDCATLANKGLEVIESHWLFGIDYDSIDILVHRESIIHAMVEYCDGSIITQMAMPDMSLPVLYALNYPNRKPYASERVDFTGLGRLSFAKPDTTRFPMLDLACQAGRRGGLSPAVFSAANEEAVRLFLDNRIGFMQIPQSTEYTLGRINADIEVTLNNILSIEDEAHAYVRDFAGKI